MKFYKRIKLPKSPNLINFGVQFAMFLAFVVYYAFSTGTVNPNIYMLLSPLLLLMIALLGLGFGIIISSLTTKYRDLAVLVTFGVQLWMYATPIVYPLSQIPLKWQGILLLNPVAPIVETFRYAFLGSGSIPWLYLGISFVTTLIVLFSGIILFNKVQKTFMDTI